VLLAEELRKLHDAGKAHGSLTPDAIALTATGLDLLPAAPGVVRVTPYTAPEVAVECKPADARSNIFSFGAVVFEIFTGRQAFGGQTGSDVPASLRGSPAPPSGSPSADRILAGCLAKDPDARWPIQEVQLELKFFTPPSAASPRPRRRIQKVQLQVRVSTGAGRRAGAPAVASRIGASDAISRAELAQFEARINGKLEAQATAAAEIQRAASEAVTTLQAELSALRADLGAAKQGAGDPALETLREQIGELHTHIAADMHEFELNLKAQSNAIDSARTAMAQTDALVERVVEALESLVPDAGTVRRPVDGHPVRI
jgi:hypothetical protein